MHRKLSLLASLPLLALGACASSGADNAATATPASVPFVAEGVDPTSTMVAASTIANTAPTAAGTSAGSGMEAGNLPDGSPMTADMASQMLATEQGRQLVAQGLAAQTGLSADAATCFVTHVDAATLSAMSKLDPQSASLSPLPAAAMASLGTALSTCNISPESLMVSTSPSSSASSSASSGAMSTTGSSAMPAGAPTSAAATSRG